MRRHFLAHRWVWLAIAITVVGFTLVGHGLRARFDPHGLSR
jgi:ABC-type dipeptide/oligopeptide/nickel transport system permease subunit